MRSRKRLIEVLFSVNPLAPGVGYEVAASCQFMARKLRGDRDYAFDVARVHLEIQSLLHPSPHIRDLATEALHYLMEDANG